MDLSKLFDSVTAETIIYFNELTPGPVLTLHMVARRRKKSQNLNGSFFVRSSNLYFKNNLTNKVECILDEEDINKIS